MKTILKWIGLLLVLTLIFGAGYLSGASREEKLSRLLNAVTSEMKTKVAGLESEVRALRFRMQLTTARDRLNAAENNIKERNFGMAEKEIESAKAELGAAAKLTSKETGETLSGIERSLNGVIEAVRRSDPRAKFKLDAVKADLDRLIGRS
ncbi:MAG: hypothetical protein HY204_11225 [Nitrospirae bacterium]|nr:hypothetical protein [Nitrospirota bacterium]